MIAEIWKYQFTDQDIADLWSYIPFTPDNSYNPGNVVVSHVGIKPTQRTRNMFIRHISANIYTNLVKQTPKAATYLAVHLMPESVPVYGDSDICIPILQGTMGSTNFLYANFPRSLYTRKGIVVYLPTAGLANTDVLIVGVLWEPTDV